MTPSAWLSFPVFRHILVFSFGVFEAIKAKGKRREIALTKSSDAQTNAEANSEFGSCYF